MSSTIQHSPDTVHPAWCDPDACVWDGVERTHRRMWGSTANSICDAVEALEWVEEGQTRRAVSVYRCENLSPEDALALARAIKDASGVFHPLDAAKQPKH